MLKEVVRSHETGIPYESRAETEAAVERIHKQFQHTKEAIAAEKAMRASAAGDSADRRPPE